MKQAPQVCCCKLGNILEIKPERVNGKLDVREAWGRKDYGPGSFEVKWTIFTIVAVQPPKLTQKLNHDETLTRSDGLGYNLAKPDDLNIP